MPLYDGPGYTSTGSARASASFLQSSPPYAQSSSSGSYLPASWQWQKDSSPTSPTSIENRVQEEPRSWWPPSNGYFNFFNSDEEEDASCCGPLTLTERIYGFCICFLAGLLVSAMSFGSFSQVLLGNPTKFAVGYTMGNILSLCATMFLVGPVRQFQSMKEKHRLGASLLYLGCLVMTLVSVYALRIGIFIIFFVSLQWIALVWYSLSYIPYGRSIASRMITSVVV